MKTLVQLFTVLLVGLTTVSAAEKIDTATQGEDIITTRYRYAQPIQFVERGVEFLIFPDGSFDFNTDITSNHYDDYDVYYRRNKTRRGSINGTFGAPGTRVKFSKSRRNRGVIIKHDYNGRVRRIGNVFINYNRTGQVKRIGSVYVSYNRACLVRQIGGLHIRYNRRGHIIATTGYVNFNNQGCGFCGVTGCSTNHHDNHHDQDDHYDNDWDDDYGNDDDNYYYKSGKKKE
jgi:hypothetical protein